MYDKELIVDILKNIAWSIEQIKKGFKPLNRVMILLRMMLVSKNLTASACS